MVMMRWGKPGAGRVTQFVVVAVFIVSGLLGRQVSAGTQVQFPRPQSLESSVGFWIRIFATHSYRDFLLIDSNDPSRLYKLYHLPGRGEPSRIQVRRTYAYLRKKYGRILKRLGAGYQPATPEQRRIARMFRGQPLLAYREAAENLRVQRGMRERFRRSLLRARHYKSTMERIFRAAGLPAELVLLAAVESGFNNTARSHRGAAGIWQFTRATARKYMTVNRRRDDRLNPIRSTRAAARLLSEYYQLLGGWPLAITAYNYGINGTLRAAEAHDNDYEKIVENYDGARFGFAVRNYYAEFLAALEVDRNQSRYFPGIENEAAIAPPSRYRVKRGDTLSHIARRFGVGLKWLMRVNGVRHPRRLRAGRILLIPVS